MRKNSIISVQEQTQNSKECQKEKIAVSEDYVNNEELRASANVPYLYCMRK